MIPRAMKMATLIAVLAASGLSHAQVERRGGDGMQRIMQQYQQVAAEKTELQAQLAQAKKELEAAQSELAAAKKERDALKVRAAGAASAQATVAQLTSAKEAAEKNLDAYKQRMTEIVARFREMAGTLKTVEAERGKLRDELQQRNEAFDKCAVDNAQLYEINGEILDKYNHVGLFTKVSAAEPFTRITRNRMDNLVLEYRERAEQLKVKQSSAAQGGTAQGPAARGAAPQSGTAPQSGAAPAGGTPGSAPQGTTPR